MSDDLASRLGDAVTQLTGARAVVTLDGATSGGATRRTYLGALDRGDGPEPIVVQLAGLHLDGLSPTAEADLVRRAGEAGVPVAEPLVATDDASLVGGPFQIARRIEGVTVPRQVLRALAEVPAGGTGVIEACGRALAALHRLDPGRAPVALPRLVDPDPATAYLDHLRTLAGGLPRSPVVALALRWLAERRPSPPSRPAVVHGDFRVGNLIVDVTGAVPGELAAVIDWELAHVGDPMEDLAWFSLRCWRSGADDLEAGGLAPLDELVDAYEGAGGSFRPDAFAWWVVARTSWWRLVLALQASAFVAGLSDSLVLAASGRRVAEIEYDLMLLIDPARTPR